jgi:hypothetical protein
MSVPTVVMVIDVVPGANGHVECLVRVHHGCVKVGDFLWPEKATLDPDSAFQVVTISRYENVLTDTLETNFGGKIDLYNPHNTVPPIPNSNLISSPTVESKIGG